VASLCFSVWHFFPLFEGTPTSTLPVTSVLSFLSCFGFDALWGYIFQRTDNVVTTWLSHALGGIARSNEFHSVHSIGGKIRWGVELNIFVASVNMVFVASFHLPNRLR